MGDTSQEAQAAGGGVESISLRSPTEGRLAPGADAALIASLLHFEKTTIKEIKKHAEAKGVCVRW
jgi:imidazole glycerol phosphate synthase subunit HisF